MPTKPRTKLITALNTPSFRDSLKEAYDNQSMQPKQEVMVEEEATPKASHIVVKTT